MSVSIASIASSREPSWGTAAMVTSRFALPWMVLTLRPNWVSYRVYGMTAKSSWPALKPPGLGRFPHDADDGVLLAPRCARAFPAGRGAGRGTGRGPWPRTMTRRRCLNSAPVKKPPHRHRDEADFGEVLGSAEDRDAFRALATEVDALGLDVDAAAEHDIGRNAPSRAVRIASASAGGQVRPSNEVDELFAGHDAHAAELGDEDRVGPELFDHVAERFVRTRVRATSYRRSPWMPMMTPRMVSPERSL